MTLYAIFCVFVFILMGIAGTIGNILIIGSVLLEKQLKNVGNMFIVNLAVADLLVTLSLYPVLSTNWFVGNTLPDFGCAISGALSSGGAIVSILNIAAIAFERYIKVCRNAFYSGIYSKRTIALHLSSLWVITIVALMPAFFLGNRSFVYESRLLFCIINSNHFPPWYTIMFSSIIICCIALCSACYVKILETVRQSRRRVRADNQRQTQAVSHRDMSLLKTVFIVFAAYLILTCPGSVVTVLFVANYNIPVELFQWSVYLLFSNSVINGFIYGITNKKFRMGYLKLVDMLLCKRSFYDRTSSIVNVPVSHTEVVNETT